MTRTSSLSERPGRHGPRRLAHWLNPTGERKVHSLVDKVYKRKNLEVAWEKVKRNRGAGGVDGEDLAAFEASLDANLERLHRELRDGEYVPQPVLRHLIPKAGQPGKLRPLGIPTIYDRVCQQALLNRLEPIFEPVFDDANYGYRRGRSAHGALRKIWRELDEGREWVVDADLADPREKSLRHFKDQIRKRTRRKAPVSTQELTRNINPVIRGWGRYYCKAHVRRLFHQLDGWIVRRIWSHRHKRWRNRGWKQLPERKLIGEYGLVRLISLVPSLNPRRDTCVKAAYGKTVRAV